MNSDWEDKELKSIKIKEALIFFFFLFKNDLLCHYCCWVCMHLIAFPKSYKKIWGAGISNKVIISIQNVAEVTLSSFCVFSIISGCGTFTFLSSAVAAVSGLLMGYELGLISGALLQMSSILALSCKEQEIIVSSLLFGALFASLTGGFLIDRFGRRLAIIIASSLLVLGSLILLPYESYGILIVGRIAIGISISLSSIATCVYIAEIAPQHRRGLLVSLNELMIVIGILFAYISNYAFASVSHGWKYMFGLVIPLGALQAIAMYFLPPSPRFLVMKNNDEAARKVLERLRETSDATRELTVIKSSLKDEHQYSFLDLFSSKNNMRARMLVGLTLVFFVQTTGQPNILFYASTVLKSVGFQSNEAASLASTGVGVVKVVSTVPATVFVDQVGSKTFLCIGSSVMAVSLVTMGLVNRNIHANFTNVCRSQLPDDLIFQRRGNLTGVTNGSLTDLFASMALPERLPFNRQRSPDVARTEELNRTALEGGKTTTGSHMESGEVPVVLKWLSLASLLVYVAAFSIGLGPSKYLIFLTLCNDLLIGGLSAGMTCPAWHQAVLKLGKAVFSDNMCWYCHRLSW